MINLYEGELSTGEQWWAAWSAFMFKDELELKTKHGVEAQRPCKMLGPISAAKYPAVTAEEEAISIPLQARVQPVVSIAVCAHALSSSETSHCQR